jgi:hypothetical protein
MDSPIWIRLVFFLRKTIQITVSLTITLVLLEFPSTSHLTLGLPPRLVPTAGIAKFV